MAHGKNAEKFGNIKDYWSARPFSGCPVSHNGNKWVKRATHKIERMRAKQQLSKELPN